MNYIPNLKYKTELCEKWENKQFCPKGTNCYFAHGDIELRTIQQNQIIVTEQNKALLAYNKELNLPTNYKTIKCKFYARGKCQLGKNCTFYHSINQRQKPLKTQLQHYANPQAFSEVVKNSQPLYTYSNQYLAYYNWGWNSQPYNLYQYSPESQDLENNLNSQNLNKSEELSDEYTQEKERVLVNSQKSKKQQKQFLQSSIETNQSLEKDF